MPPTLSESLQEIHKGTGIIFVSYLLGVVFTIHYGNRGSPGLVFQAIIFSKVHFVVYPVNTLHQFPRLLPSLYFFKLFYPCHPQTLDS